MNYATKSSRDLDLLHPMMKYAFECASEEFQRSNKFNHLTPAVSQTTRDTHDQAKFYEAGKSRAMFGQSAHNYEPALAFDIFFSENGKTNYDMEAIRFFAELAKGYGVEWSGDWPNTFEFVHFQYPGIQSHLTHLVGVTRLNAIEGEVGDYITNDNALLDQVKLIKDELGALERMIRDA